MECTWNSCKRESTHMMGWKMVMPCFWIAPYCDEHTEKVEESNGAIAVTGLGLLPELVEISGIRK